MKSLKQYLLAACACAAVAAHAAFPERTITMVVPYAPGGAADAVARVVATRLGAKLGVSVIVDNKAGASGTIGAGFVAGATTYATLCCLAVVAAVALLAFVPRRKSA